MADHTGWLPIPTEQHPPIVTPHWNGQPVPRSTWHPLNTIPTTEVKR
jgi:hypothetical protein